MKDPFEIGRGEFPFEVLRQEFDPEVAGIRPVTDIGMEGHVGARVQPQRRAQLVRTAQSEPQFSIMGS